MVSAAIAVASVSASAIFVQPDIEDVPVDRIIANLSAALAANPKDAALHARLARVHAIAYARQTSQFPAKRGTGEPWFEPGAATPPIVTPAPAQGAAGRRQHLGHAIVHYRESLKLADDQTVRLGYGWALDQSGDRAAAVREYRTVIDRAWPKEREKKAFMPGEVSLAVEAGGYLERLLDPSLDKAEIDAIRERRLQIARVPRAITPIAVPLRDRVPVDRLVDRGRGVLFDADGSRLPRRWTWLGADAAWLVYDPRARGRITSALQLFGSVTFWMFWHDGYEALAALDDNGDGSLRGVELTGLALWHDRDRNGISDPGEVEPLGRHRIVALSCRAERTPTHAHVAAFAIDGVTFADGTRRPTYDVVLRSFSSLTN